MAEPVISPLQIADTKTAGFIGIAQKGPIDEPRRITSWDEFAELYGYTSESYLSDSIEAYFRNGGQACFVVRVAHVPRDDSHPGMEHAAAAIRVVKDDWNKPTLRISALNEGRWGNNIWVSFEHSTGATALLTQDLEIGVGEALVSSTRGFKVGQLVRLYDRENSDYVILTDIGERVLRWGPETPVNRLHRAASPTYLEVLSFELHVALKDRREVFKGLQMHPSSRQYAPRVIAAESRLVKLDDLKANSPPPHNLPEPEPPTKLSAGRDGTDKITPDDFIGVDHGPSNRSGLLAMCTVAEAATLVCPDAMIFLDRAPGPEGEVKTQRVQDALIERCEVLKDRFAIIDCPQTRDIEVVKRWRRRTDSSYAAYYWPWVGVPRTDGTIKRIPPSGIMAGVFARCDHADGVHQAPANVPIAGAIDLSVPVTEDDLGALNAEGINVFRIARGIRPWGARTASSDPDWRFVNVRRLFIMLRRSLEAGMQWVPFENNDNKTWESLTDMVTAFMGDIHQMGMFSGGKPEDSFYVRCNEETNPPDAVNKGILTIQIGLAPSIPAEFITISVVEKMTPDA